VKLGRTPSEVGEAIGRSGQADRASWREDDLARSIGVGNPTGLGPVEVEPGVMTGTIAELDAAPADDPNEMRAGSGSSHRSQ
jgi:hypothetical protein